MRDVDPISKRRLLFTARSTAIVGGALALAELFGWLRELSGPLGWLAACVAVLLLSSRTPRRRFFAAPLAVIPILIGSSVPIAQPEQIGLAWIDLTLIGVAILARCGNDKTARASNWLAAVVMAAAILGLLGNIFDVSALHLLPRSTIMGPYASAGLFCLALSILSLDPVPKPMAVLTSRTPAGVVARYFLIGGGIGSIAINWLSLVGHRAGHYGPGFLTAMSVVGELAVFTTSAVLAAFAVERIDAERALASEQMRLAYEEARLADRKKDEFLAMLGHELRNPLSPILTALELMRIREDVNGRAREVIQRQVRHLTRLVDDLLDVSRFARGRIELKKEPAELSTIVARAIETASPLLEERSHRLTVEVPGEGLGVQADPMRLSQVVSNLLTNAAKYTEPRGLVEVRARREGAEVVLSVRDNGVGIAPELMPKMFDLFVQSERTIERAKGGLGLGLTIAKSLVELHGGSIHVASAGPMSGSEFSVRLPLIEVPVGTPPLIALRPNGAATERAMRVLVVDDNPDAAELLAEFLEEQGHEIAVAHDGPRALEEALAFRPEIAVLDIGLPVMDGYELARKLRTMDGLDRIRLIALTGYGQAQDREAARKAGFDHHLVKPFDPEQLAPLLV